MTEKEKTWREANKDRIKAVDRAYRESNKESIRDYKLNYRKANKDKISAYSKTYKKNNPHKVRADKAKRRAAKLKATPPWLEPSHFIEMEEIYRNCPEGYHVDHIVPLQGDTVCGLHVPWNLRSIPATENLRKSNKIGG